MAIFLLIFFYLYIGVAFASTATHLGTLPEVSPVVLILMWPYEMPRHFSRWYGVTPATLYYFAKLSFKK